MHLIITVIIIIARSGPGLLLIIIARNGPGIIITISGLGKITTINGPRIKIIAKSGPGIIIIAKMDLE